MSPQAGPATPLRLSLARACAWALLVAGWIGLGSFALQFAPSLTSGFALVALWLLALGAVATIATRGGMRWWTRALALCAGASVTGVGLYWTVHGGGVSGVIVAVAGWATMTALASGVVRSLRPQYPVRPQPPIAAATLGALCAGVALGDTGDVGALAVRLIAFVGAITLLLLLLQLRTEAQPRPGCRAGLFDCSLPAWPAGAWRDPLQWPTLLAGLAMLPMMAALPLMAAWCRAQSVPPQWMVLVHLGAMFLPPLLLRSAVARWSTRVLATVCAALLAAGAGCALFAPAPFDLFGLAALHGAAWGLAWAGQLWAPARGAEQGTSPLRAAADYAALTLVFGIVVEQAGARGAADVHAALGVLAIVAWLVGAALRPLRAGSGSTRGEGRRDDDVATGDALAPPRAGEP